MSSDAPCDCMEMPVQCQECTGWCELTAMWFCDECKRGFCEECWGPPVHGWCDDCIGDDDAG